MLPHALVHGVQVVHIHGGVRPSLVEVLGEEALPGVVADERHPAAARRQLPKQAVLCDVRGGEGVADIQEGGQAASEDALEALHGGCWRVRHEARQVGGVTCFLVDRQQPRHLGGAAGWRHHHVVPQRVHHHQHHPLVRWRPPAAAAAAVSELTDRPALLQRIPAGAELRQLHPREKEALHEDSDRHRRERHCPRQLWPVAASAQRRLERRHTGRFGAEGPPAHTQAHTLTHSRTHTHEAASILPTRRHLTDRRHVSFGVAWRFSGAAMPSSSARRRPSFAARRRPY
mmetsp:Transcript_31834/g.80443  ORF Transcript_31834/g.80443 Transcript_31834/m.80443 type:complete len:287 (-) Transcript_31834:39-899(-)